MSQRTVMKSISRIFLFAKTEKTVLMLVLVSFMLNLFLLQGVPFFMYGHDDFSMAWTAKNASWGTLVKGLLFDRISLDEGNFYFGLGYRSTYFILYKVLMAIDGMRFPEINHLFRLVLFSLNVMLLFKLLKTFKINTLFSAGGVLVYSTAVPTYEVLHFVGDLTLYSHFFMLLCFYVFLTRYCRQPKTNPFGISVLVFFTALLAIKSKQIAIVIPPVLFLYCLCVKENRGGVRKRRMPLFSVLLLYYLPSPFSSTAKRSLSDLLLSLRTYYFYNPWTRIGAGEQVPALLSPLNSYVTAAGSLMGVYKFLLGWIVVCFMIFFVYSLYHNYRVKGRIKDGQFLLFIVLWHVSEVGIMTAYFASHLFEALRYIGIAVPSFVALTFFGMQQGFSYLEEKAKIKNFDKIVYCIFIVAITLTIVSNVYSSAVQIRGGLLSRHVLIHDSLGVVYKDYFKKETVDDTIFFRIFHEADNRLEEEKLSQITFTQLATEFGENYDPQNVAVVRNKLKEKGFVYVLTFKSEVPFPYNVLLKKLSACPPESSWYCYLKDKLKGQDVFFSVFKVFNTPVRLKGAGVHGT